MNVEHELEKLAETYNDRGYPTEASLELIDAVLQNNSDSARLWDLRGDLIQLCDEQDCKYTLKDAEQSYSRAIELDPNYWQAYQSLGYYHDLFTENFGLAETFFKKALAIEATVSGFVGLARVLAEQGKTDEAISLLSREQCPFFEELDVRKIRDEILNGDWQGNA